MLAVRSSRVRVPPRRPGGQARNFSFTSIRPLADTRTWIRMGELMVAKNLTPTISPLELRSECNSILVADQVTCQFEQPSVSESKSNHNITKKKKETKYGSTHILRFGIFRPMEMRSLLHSTVCYRRSSSPSFISKLAYAIHCVLRDTQS
jgi:hypothetical protein